MLTGWKSELVKNFNCTNYLLGDYWAIYNETTPIRNYVYGFQSKVDYGIYTGSNDLDEIGQVRMINGQHYVNKMSEIFNGTFQVNITQNDPKSSESQAKLKKVSSGMQFPPGISTDDQLHVYDSRNIKVMSYTHDDTTDVDDLRLEKFKATNHGGDVGFAYNLPLYSEARNCYGCQVNPEELRNVKLDNQEYVQATKDSDNYILVQPNSGYLYSSKKTSTVFFIVGGNQAFIPYQQKVTPFPRLDSIYGQAFPLYDYTETIQADKDEFTDRYGYIKRSEDSVSASVIAMSVLAAFFLIMGIVAITVYKLKDPKRQNNANYEEQLVQSDD